MKLLLLALAVVFKISFALAIGHIWEVPSQLVFLFLGFNLLLFGWLFAREISIRRRTKV